MLEDIDLYKDNPTAIIDTVIEQVEDKLEGKVIGDNFTSPLHMLIEMSATLSKDNLLGADSIMKSRIPTLANDKDMLFNHITDNEKLNIFSVPGEADFSIYLNVLDIKQQGYRKEGSTFRTVSIPINSVIKIKNLKFTILNRIDIRLYDNGTVSVEQLANEEDLARNDIGLLKSAIITDNKEVEWIVFKTRVKNITRIISTIAIPPGKEDLVTTLPLTSKYVSCNVYYLNNIDGKSEKVYLPTSYSGEYINPSKPTAILSVGEELKITIPKVYLIEDVIPKTKLIIELFLTDGEVYSPIEKLNNEEFVIEYAKGTDEPTSVINQVTPVLMATTPLQGGKDAMGFKELKESIIRNTIGDLDLPVTTYQLEKKAITYGYQLHELRKTLTSNIYIAAKDLVLENKLILADMDTFFNTVEIILSRDEACPGIIKRDDTFVIKANSMFSLRDGKVTPLENYDIELINSLPRLDLIDHFKNNRIFYTPYEYVVYNKEGVTESEVYYFNPVINSNRIIGKNRDVDISVNLDKYRIDKTVNGYRLLFQLVGDKGYESLDKSKIRLRLSVPLYDSKGLRIYFDGKYNEETGLVAIDIDTEISKENKMIINNGASKLHHNEINIETDANVYIYSNDSTIGNSAYLHGGEFEPPYKETVVFTKEQLSIRFNTRVEYLFNNVYNTYTERKFLQHTEDVYETYLEDVYEEDEDGTFVKAEVKLDNRVILTTKLLHKKGDFILDENGNKVLKHAKNSIVLDEDGKRILDYSAGVKRFIDILMFEAEFMYTESDAYKSYISLLTEKITNASVLDMKELNKITIDETTKILYKSSKSTNQVVVKVNGIKYLLEDEVKPSIKLYLINTAQISPEVLDSFRDITGKVISKHLNNDVIVLRQIKDEIMSELGDSVQAVTLEGIDPINSEIISVVSTNRFSMAKKLEHNKSGMRIVRYDFKSFETIIV